MNIYIYIYIEERERGGDLTKRDVSKDTRIYNKSKLATIVEGNPKNPFSIVTINRCKGGCDFFPWIAPLYP